MTRNRLMEIAAANGLALDVERVTTGPAAGPAFREFEFISPDAKALQSAAQAIKSEWTPTPGFVTVRNSDIDFQPYLRVSSFYCGPKGE